LIAAYRPVDPAHGDVTVATTFGDHDSANSANPSSMLIG
jgi:hypothetical protein